MWEIRPAHTLDLTAVDALIAAVGGDQENLTAEQFLVAQDAARVIIGCVRLKPYASFRELASLAVRAERQRSGVGRALVSRMLEGQPGPIYLMCEDNVVDFFRRFGFALLQPAEPLPELTRKWEYYLAEVGQINLMRRD